MLNGSKSSTTSRERTVEFLTSEAKIQEYRNEIRASINALDCRVRGLEAYDPPARAINPDAIAATVREVVDNDRVEMKTLKRARNSARDAVLLKAMMVARNPEVKCYTRELLEAVDAYDEVNDAFQDVRKCKQRGGDA